MMPQISRALLADNLETTHLSCGLVAATLIPELGGKIASLRTGAIEWLWRNPYLPHRRPDSSDDFVTLHDTGGIDECFPTVDPCTILHKARTVSLRDHGMVWAQGWRETSISTDADSATQTLEANPAWLPGITLRRMAVVRASSLELAYQLFNTTPDPVPFVYYHHPLFSWDEFELELPDGLPLAVTGGAGGAVPARGTTVHWPYLPMADGSRVHLMARSSKASGHRLAVKLLALDTPDSVLIRHRTTGTALQLAINLPSDFPLGATPQWAFWLNLGGWAGAPACHRPDSEESAYWNFAPEPGAGWHDSLADAIASEMVHELTNRKELSWNVRYQLAPAIQGGRG